MPRGPRVFICGPPDSGCYVYGSKVSDQHIWETARSAGPWEHGEGPLCAVCGLPRGTYEWETKPHD